MISLSYCDQSFALPLGCHPYRDRAHGRYVVQLYYLKSTGAESPKYGQLRWAARKLFMISYLAPGRWRSFITLRLAEGLQIDARLCWDHIVDLSSREDGPCRDEDAAQLFQAISSVTSTSCQDLLPLKRRREAGNL